MYFNLYNNCMFKAGMTTFKPLSHDQVFFKKFYVKYLFNTNLS